MSEATASNPACCHMGMPVVELRLSKCKYDVREQSGVGERESNGVETGERASEGDEARGKRGVPGVRVCMWVWAAIPMQRRA